MMNGQTAFIRGLPLPIHRYPHHSHTLQRQQQNQHVRSIARTNPAQEHFSVSDGGLAPPSSASYSGSLRSPLPYRPAAAVPAVQVDCTHTNTNQQAHHQALPHSHSHSHSHSHHQDHFGQSTTLRMGAFEQQQDEELARLQELSNKWEPEASGPLVSELLSSSAIATEYANADPVYQAKTAALPQTYTQYRTCRGDGHCGWRAVAFSYFEALVRIGDPHKFLEEETRLKSLCNILNDAGFQEHLYEDFMEDTIDLLRKTSSAADGGAVLLEAFNDLNSSMSIITYLKLLTSSWMQKYPEQFEPFVNEPLQNYCRSHIEPAVCEIEHVGMSALVDVLVKPAGIAVEILYLDRTPGTAPNVYRFAPADQIGVAQQDPPTFRLLYRPGHYDILYKAEDFPSRASTQQNILVALNYGSTETIHHKTPYELDFEIPGGSIYTPSVNWSTYPQYDLAPSFDPSPATLQVESPRSAPTPSYATPVVHTPAPEYIPPPQSVPLSPPAMTILGIPHHPAQHPPIDRGGPFRPSIYELESSLAPSTGMCQTAIFRNSHYNTAHFNNPDFEPEQWQPGSDYHQGDRSRKRSSHSQ